MGFRRQLQSRRTWPESLCNKTKNEKHINHYTNTDKSRQSSLQIRVSEILGTLAEKGISSADVMGKKRLGGWGRS